MAIPSERETLRQALDDLAATPVPPPHRGDVALAEYCRRQLTHRRRSLGLLAAVIILAVGWITARSGRARPWSALQPHGRHADRRAARRDQYRELAVEWDEARDNPPEANRLFDALLALYKELRDSAAGRQAIASLLDDPITARFEALAVDEAVSEAWALLVSRLRAAGRKVPINDSWIAATAIAHRVPIVTQDSDYDAMLDVQVIKI